jgi:predicted alpha/beta-fold hydrolase
MGPPFAARWPFSSPHLQTLGAALPVHVRVPDSARDEPLRFALPGNGALHASGWFHSQRRSLVLLVHGVGGSVRSQYMVRAAKAFYAAGHHVVRLNLRGAGDSIADAPTLYHAGLTEDLAVACAALAARADVGALAAVGFSLGGNCVLRFASEQDAAHPLLRAAIAISAPVDLAAVSLHLNRPLNLPYRAYILRGLLTQGRAYLALRPQSARYTAKELARVRTIWAYDDLVVAPMHGLGTAARYYAQMSAGSVLRGIHVPTLMIHAEDDPLVPGRTVGPFAELAGSAVELAFSAQGGHVGWFSGLGESAWLRTWAVDRALEFLGRHLPG